MAGRRTQRATTKRRPRQATVKAVASRVVKRAIARTLEHKRLGIVMPDLDVYHLHQYVMAPLSIVAKGVEEYQRVGDQIHNVYLNLGLSYFHIGLQNGLTRVWNGSKLRVIVIKSNRVLGTGMSWSDQNATSGTFPKLMAESLQGSVSPINTHDYTVLADRTLSSMNNWDVQGTYGAPATLRLRLSLGKQVRFQDTLVSGYPVAKGTQIYVIVTASNVQSATTDIAGKLQCSGYLSFTDA